MSGIGESDYRRGARERLEEAWILLRDERFAGSVYLAGRAVEGMLRALIWRSDPDYVTGRKTLDTGHDLRDLLRLVRGLGVLRDAERRDLLAADIQQVARLWFNNMRFLGAAKVRDHWVRIGEVGGGRSLKKAAGDYYDRCSAVVKRCEVLCQR